MCVDICFGLDQGKPLFPLIYVLFVNDLYSFLQTDDAESQINGVDIDQMTLLILMFADNMVLFSENANQRIYEDTT